METLKDFTERFCRDVGCYYKENKRNNSLKKYDSDYLGEMGVFGWIGERITKNLFVISTWEHLTDAQAIVDADKRRVGGMFGPKGKDTNGKWTSLSFYIKRNSSGHDYEKAVRALSVARKNR